MKITSDIKIPSLTEDKSKPTNTGKIKAPEGSINFEGFDPSKLDNIYYDNVVRPSETFIPVGNTGVGKSSYDDGITLTQLADLEAYRADKQGLLAKTFNSLVGGAASGGVGVAENFSVLADVIAQKVGLMEDFEKSAITEGIQGAKDWINELTPIYRKNRDKTFDWTDSGFYFEMLKGATDSAVAFGFAGAGYAGLMRGLAGTLGKTTLAGHRLNVWTRALGSKVGQANIADDLTTLGAAFLSNYGEGTIMALETYETEKEKLMTVGERTLRNQRAQELGTDPSEVQLTDDDYQNIELYAIEEAGKAGHNMRTWNHALLMSNVYQMRAIAGIKGWMTGGKGSLASRNMQERAFKPNEWGFWKQQALGAPLEAGEEIAQNVIQMESRYRADTRAMSKGLVFNQDELESQDLDIGRRLLGFATSDQALLEGLMGFVSGPIQYGITQAPFQGKRVEEINKRYATQQALIGKNTEFIKNKLKQTATAEDLASRFEEYREEVLGRDPKLDTPELREQDSEKFKALIENTTLDTLIQENLFNGTTADLEAQLQEVISKQPANEEQQLEIEHAQRALERLNLLENRFNSYNKYINGAEIFAADLRGERLNSIIQDLESSFSNSEKQVTQDIQDFLEDFYTQMMGDQFDGNLTNLSENFELAAVNSKVNGKGETVTDIGNKREVNSVTDIVNGLRDGYKLFSKTLPGQMALGNLASINRVARNRVLLDATKEVARNNRRFVNESKTMDYQDLYANYQDAMASRDENDIHEMGLVKANLEEVLKDRRFKKDGKYQPFEQLKLSIESQIEDINNKIQGIETQENNLQKEKVTEVKTQSKKDDKEAKKGTTTQQVTSEEELPPVTPEGVNPIANQLEQQVEAKTYPSLQDNARNILLNLPPIENRPEKTFPQALNPDTGKLEDIHSARIQDVDGTSMIQISFPSSPTKFHNFDNQEGERYIPLAKEFREEQIQADPANKPQVNPKSTTQTRATDTSTVPEKQIDNSKPQTKPTNGKVTEVEPVITDINAALQFMKDQVFQTTDLEGTQVDVIEVGVTQDGKPILQSANAKTLDYNFEVGRQDAYSEFLKNKKNKAGVPVIMEVDTNFQNANALFKGSKGKASEAINIFNKLKKAGIKNIKDWNKAISAEEFEILVNYLPVRFSVQSNPEISSWIHVTSSTQQKQAERILREDTINGALSGTQVIRNLKGQGPGKLNEIAPTKVIDFMTDENKLDNAILHVSVGGALVAVDEQHEDMFAGTMMTYTDAQGVSHGWDGVFTIAVTNMAGERFPVKLNTLGHSQESAQVVAEILREVINPAYKTKDTQANVGNMVLKTVAPNAYQWLKTNMPTIFKVYGDNAKVQDVLGDLIYYGKQTIGSHGHLNFANGIVSFGGENNLSYHNNLQPIQLSYNDLLTEEGFSMLTQFIQEVKPYNVQLSRLRNPNKAERLAYKEHVFSNYMESTVNLSNAFTKEYHANQMGDKNLRYENAHLYISSVPSTQQEVKTPAPAVKTVKTSSNIKSIEKSKGLDTSREKPNLQEEKTNQAMKEQIEKEIKECPTGGVKPSSPKPSLMSGLNKRRKK